MSKWVGGWVGGWVSECHHSVFWLKTWIWERHMSKNQIHKMKAQAGPSPAQSAERVLVAVVASWS